MTPNLFRELPLEALYELLVPTVKEMLNASDTNQHQGVAFRTKVKQVELLISEIERKRLKGSIAHDNSSHPG